MTDETTPRAVILVGHGAPPSDAPPELVSRLKRLEGERRRRGSPPPPPSVEERELDAKLRAWPRTAANDPYQGGIERLAIALRAALGGTDVVVAYNEFCAPSLEDAVRSVAARGTRRIVVVPSMLTRGGVHSEVEIPEALDAVRAELPAGVEVTYAWPFAEADVAALLAARVALA